MNSYPQKVKDNILPLSVADTLPKAFEEWSFTENTIDHEKATEVCELCNHEEIRYHFEIKNALTRKVLWVGSQCILKFNLSVFEKGQKLTPEESKKKLERLMQKMRLDSCIKALENLAKAENNNILSSALDYYKKNKYLTPKLAFVVFWRLNEHKIDYSPSFFKINVQKSKYQQDLKEMQLSRVHIIWPALSSSQRKMAAEMGHTPPSHA